MVPVQSARGAMVSSYNERGRQTVALVVDLLGEPKLRLSAGGGDEGLCFRGVEAEVDRLAVAELLAAGDDRDGVAAVEQGGAGVAEASSSAAGAVAVRCRRLHVDVGQLLQLYRAGHAQ